jgi:hypothetical protein
MAAALASWSLVAARPQQWDAATPFRRLLHPFCDGSAGLHPIHKIKATASMKKSKRKTTKRRPGKTPVLERELHPDAAGLDIAANEIVAAIPPDRPDETVRSFTTFTKGLHELRDWLLANRITTVAMESTGSFWIPCYNILEAAGIEVFLVNVEDYEAQIERYTAAVQKINEGRGDQ